MLAGTLATKAPAAGSYTYRVIVLNPQGKGLAVLPLPLFSYANVPLGQLIGTAGNTVTFNGTLFRFVFENHYGEPLTMLKLDATSCRRADPLVAKDGNGTGTANLTIVQESVDPRLW